MNYFREKLKSIIMISQRGLLPKGYKLCEYIESTGTQYIDTGYICSSDSKVEIKYLHNSGSGVFGARYDGSNKGFNLNYGSSDNKLYRGFGSTNNTSFVNDKKEHIIILDKSGLYLDDKIIINSSSSIFTCPSPACIFAMINSSTSSIYTSSGRCYYCKIWNNNELVRDSIPCLDNNNRPCMYDTVSKQTFYNQGSGEEFSYKLMDPVWSGDLRKDYYNLMTG